MGRGRWRLALSPSRTSRAFYSFRSSGFTLIELMIVVAVVAILAAIAIPSYSRYVLRANRSAVEQVMLDVATAEERYMIDNRSYAASQSSVGYTTWSDTVSSNYTITITPNAGPPPTFTITAAPQGNQVNDTTCGTLTYTSNGNKSPAPTTCWR